MSPRVLIVDNEREMVTLMQRHLEAEGLTVTPFCSGPAADLRAVLQHQAAGGRYRARARHLP